MYLLKMINRGVNLHPFVNITPYHIHNIFIGISISEIYETKLCAIIGALEYLPPMKHLIFYIDNTSAISVTDLNTFITDRRKIRRPGRSFVNHLKNLLHKRVKNTTIEFHHIKSHQKVHNFNTFENYNADQLANKVRCDGNAPIPFILAGEEKYYLTIYGKHVTGDPRQCIKKNLI